jgi:3-deoxy-D-manno-octulosonic-acid transferase
MRWFLLFLYELLQHLAFHVLRAFAPFLKSDKTERFVSSRLPRERKTALESAKKILKEHSERKKNIWVHVASAGELEQAIPPLRSLVENNIANVFLTYYSPSTEPFLKNAPFLSGHCSFPLDIEARHRNIINTLGITDIILVRYELWPSLFAAAKAANIPVHLLGATTKPSRQRFHNWGGLFFKRFFFKQFSTIFTVSESDSHLFREYYRASNVITAGDSKWARAKERAKNLRSQSPRLLWFFNWVVSVCNQRPIFVFGSPHKEEHDVALQLAQHTKNQFLIYVPHDCSEAHVSALHKQFEQTPSHIVRFSQLNQNSLPQNIDVVIIDKIGFLAEIYSIADAAVVGGGFDGQIHNTLEPAAHPVPTLFGSFVHKAPEALTLLEKESAIGFDSAKDLLQFLLNNPNQTTNTHNKRDYLLSLARENSSHLFDSVPNTGAIICDYFQSQCAKKGTLPP